MLARDELKGIAASSMSEWVFPYRARGVRTYSDGPAGMKRKNGHIPHVTARAQNAQARYKITEWDQNSCSHLSNKFKELLIVRAKIARLSGFKNYFEYRSVGKMLDSKSASKFMDNLRSKMAPRIDSHLKKILTLKLQGM